MFYDYEDFSYVKIFVEELKKQWVELRREALNAYDKGLFQKWPEEHLHAGGWSVLGAKWQGAKYSESAPILHSIVEKYGDMIFNAGYSRMESGTEILPHDGMTSKVLRLHLGLDIPEGDCAIIVGDQRGEWKNGEILFFDDMILHSAHNRTKEARTIALIDINKKYLA